MNTRHPQRRLLPALALALLTTACGTVHIGAAPGDPEAHPAAAPRDGSRGAASAPAAVTASRDFDPVEPS